MATQIFDDGSTLTTDPAGNVIGVTDFNGNPVPVVPVWNSVSNTLANGLNLALQRLLAPPVAPAAVQVQAAPGNMSGALLLGAIAIAAVLAFEALK